MPLTSGLITADDEKSWCGTACGSACARSPLRYSGMKPAAESPFMAAIPCSSCSAAAAW